jgi:glutaredoxin
MASRDPAVSPKSSLAKSIPWWVVSMAVTLSLAVLAFAMRSGGGQEHVIAAEPTAPGAPSTGLLATGVSPTGHEGQPRGDVSLATASETVSIEMYSAAWCTACSRAKAWMREQNISYHEIDVDQRSGAMGQLAVLNPRRTLPTFDVQGQVLVGFEPDALATAIRGAAR